MKVALIMGFVWCVGCASGQTAFVPFRSQWFYSDDGSDQGDAWRQQGFDPESEGWSSGLASLGYGRTQLNTQIRFGSDLGNRHRTTYFLHEFEVSSLQISQINVLELSCVLERRCGAIVYLNGTEIWREGMPDEGMLDFQTFADGSGGPFDTESSTALPDLLAPGRNMLAVEVHLPSPAFAQLSIETSLTGQNIPPNFGAISPPASTAFEDAELYQPVIASYRRADGELEIEWDATGSTDRYFVTDVDPFTLDPFPNSRFVIWEGGAEFETEGIDLRGFSDVMLDLDMRAKAVDGSFSESSFVSIDAAISDDGIIFRTENLELVDAQIESRFETEFVTELTERTAFVPLDDSLGNDWIIAGFNDASWNLTIGGIGYDRGSTFDPFIGLDLEDEMYGSNGSVYVRIPFVVATEPDETGLALLMRYDDGFVAYLNGIEVARKNASGFPPVWDALATATNADAAAIKFERFPIPVGLIVVGENILAVHGLNKTTTSSDMLISPMLVAGAALPGQAEIVSFAKEEFTPLSWAIPDSANSLAVMIRGTMGIGEQVQIDNLRVTGRPNAEQQLFADWAGNFPGIEMPPGGDPDHDRLPNAIEFYMGLNPTIAEATPLSARIDKQRSLVVVSFPRSVGVVVESAGIEWSSDLQSWSSVGVGEAVVTQVLPDGREMVEVAVPIVGNRVLVRLSVEP